MEKVEYDRIWRKSNRQKLNAQARQRYSKNPSYVKKFYNKQKQLERVKNWQKRHPERVKYLQDKQAPITRAKRRAKHHFMSDQERDLTNYYTIILKGDLCSYCNGSMQSIDHIVPVEQYGPYHYSNLTAACTRCNSSKQDKPLLRFLLRKKGD